MTTPPENRIARKRFYIAASYADQASRVAMTNHITFHGGAVVGHPLSADYYVAVSYNKPKLLGAEVVDARTLMDKWVPDAVELYKQKLIHFGRQLGKTDMTQHILRTQAEVEALRERQQELEVDQRLTSIEAKLTQITNQINALSFATSASTRPAYITDIPTLNAKLAEHPATLSDEELAIKLCDVWSNGSVYNNPWLRVAKKARELLQPTTPL